MSLTTTFLTDEQAATPIAATMRARISFFNPITSGNARRAWRVSAYAGVVLDFHALPGGLDVDRHHVDAGRQCQSKIARDAGQRQPQPGQLALVDRLGRAPEPVSPAELHLDGHERGAVADHQVHLATRESRVRTQDFEPFEPKKQGGDFLAPLAGLSGAHPPHPTRFYTALPCGPPRVATPSTTPPYPPNCCNS